MDLLDDDGLLDIRRRARGTDPAAVTRELSDRVRRDDVPERNSALNDWAANLGNPRQAPTAESCHLCGKAAHTTCNQCGNKACTADFWVMYGLCRRCAKDDRVHNAQRTPEPEETNWLGES